VLKVKEGWRKRGIYLERRGKDKREGEGEKNTRGNTARANEGTKVLMRAMAAQL